ncbi:hypothetical protein RGAI101_422 [Roseobacter sp. GAI101]|nr:hypothetical protein RGAI101_422 [Roseobacter sp. GAI101]
MFQGRNDGPGASLASTENRTELEGQVPLSTIDIADGWTERLQDGAAAGVGTREAWMQSPCFGATAADLMNGRRAQ